jgi:Ca2+-binding RTX toxin-like protein
LNGCTASGAGGNDYIDLGTEGGIIAIGDHALTYIPGLIVSATAIGAGNDVIIAGSAGERLIGDSSVGPEGLAIGAGNDTIDGFGGDDRMLGDNAFHPAIGGTAGTSGGNDVLDGGTGNDALQSGPANDVLDGGATTDDCNGENGMDTAVNCETITGVP